MRIAATTLLAAIGAILIWALDTRVSGVDLATIGWILIIAGGVGFLASLIWRKAPWPNEPDARR